MKLIEFKKHFFNVLSLHGNLFQLSSCGRISVHSLCNCLYQAGTNSLAGFGGARSTYSGLEVKNKILSSPTLCFLTSKKICLSVFSV